VLPRRPRALPPPRTPPPRPHAPNTLNAPTPPRRPNQLSDRYGRKFCLFSAALLSAVFSAACAAAPSYWAFFAFRTLAGLGAAGTSLGAFVLATEAIGPAWRGPAGIFTQVRPPGWRQLPHTACIHPPLLGRRPPIRWRAAAWTGRPARRAPSPAPTLPRRQVFFIAGEFTLVLVAVVLFPASWRAQVGACAVLSGALLLVWPLLPESGRWLLAQGRGDDALQVRGALLPPGSHVACAAARRAAAGHAGTPARGLNQRVRLPRFAQWHWVLAPHSCMNSPLHARQVLKTFAARNGTHMPDHPLASLQPPPSAAGAAGGNAGASQQPRRLTLAAALRDWHIARRFACLSFSWFAVCLAYYGEGRVRAPGVGGGAGPAARGRGALAGCRGPSAAVAAHPPHPAQASPLPSAPSAAAWPCPS
jgi:MFS family permease